MEVRANAEGALLLLSERPVDLVLTDVMLPAMSGLDLVSRIQAIDPNLPVLVVSRINAVAQAVDAMRRGAFDYVLKPVITSYSIHYTKLYEILVKEVENGLVSPSLKKLKKGGFVIVEEPVGYFTINQELGAQQKYVFVASGTGISPFHSFIKSNPNLDYTLLHGIKDISESYEAQHYDKKRLKVCTSRDSSGDYYGRVTAYLQEHPFSKA